MTVRIVTASSSATLPADCRGQVVVSGSYGGEYNAWHAAKWGIRGVVLCDAGVGRDRAGVKGLDWLDRLGIPGATADTMTCHIADGEHVLEHGTVSFVNDAARTLGCAPGQSVRDCAERMKAGPVVDATLPAIAGGQRHTVHDVPGEPKVICSDAAPMLTLEDAGAIAVTGSHAALFRGRPDDVIKPALHAVFFSDAGVGLDGAGIARLADLDGRAMPAGTVSADSAPIGDARRILDEGVLSHVNRSAAALGLAPGQRLRDAVDRLLERARGSGR
ncbi:MAG: hypothetical protein WCK28_21695 [Burkholderiales bacterium]|jgi:uncharacterized protein YunC (DUF1805 family)